VEWWREAAGILGRGKLLTIDYGFEAEDFFRPERAGGSLRAYYRHHLNPDVLAQPGQQDLTTHVNFTALQQAGEAAGLNTERFASQAQFLTGIAPHLWQGEAPFGEWTPQQRRQFLTLTHPEHLGRPFRVLIQSRGLQNQ
jgi:SAM-dependent MidA family methyltransferase